MKNAPASQQLSRPSLFPENGHLSQEQMDSMGAWFRAKKEQARHPKQELARTRVWIVFLLIRYAGLRLGEALQLDDKLDISLADARISVSGQYARDIPMALPLLAHMQRLLDEPAQESMRGRLTRLDQGYVRRCFYACAEECGLKTNMAAPRVIRRSRGIELIRKGLPLSVVEFFLGQGYRRSNSHLAPFSETESMQLLRRHLHREAIMKTSARNVFSGRIVSVRQSSFLVEVVIRTLSGFEVVAVITEESLNTLELFEGKPIVATIKAPWVTLHRHDDEYANAKNRFPGEVIRVQLSELATEVVVQLTDGSRMCAVVVADGEAPPNIRLGETIDVSFKAFAVVLTVVQQ